MPIKKILLFVVLAVAALLVTALLQRRGPSLPPAPKVIDKPDEEIGPKVAKEGPQPKAVTPETSHDFGVMEHMSEGSYDFVLKNEGQAPLEVMARPEDSTCSCTVGDFGEGNKTIAPGAETKVKVKWKIKMTKPEFRHTIKVRTNDPEHRIIELTITGQVQQALQLRPEGEWAAGDIAGISDQKLTGSLFSPIYDKFEITSVDNHNPHVQVTWQPLSPADLGTIQAKSGYEILVVISKDLPIGALRETITLKTDKAEHPEVSFVLTAHRNGPIDVRGPGWANDTSMLLMGEIDHDQKREVTLSLYVRENTEPLKIEEISSDRKDGVELRMVQDERFKAKNAERYLLTVTLPPGPAMIRQRDDAEHLVLKLNHPKVPELKLSVAYTRK